MTTPSGEPIFPRLRPDEEPRRRPSTAVIATSALALILVIILAIVLLTRNTGASKDDLVKAAQQATDQAQAAQDAKDQKAAADKAVACCAAFTRSSFDAPVLRVTRTMARMMTRIRASALVAITAVEGRRGSSGLSLGKMGSPLGVVM